MTTTGIQCSADIARIMADALKAQGAKVSPVRGDEDGRFGGFDVQMPNGQQFRIQTEEM